MFMAIIPHSRRNLFHIEKNIPSSHVVIILNTLCSHKIQFIPLYNQRITFWMSETIYFEINVKVWPLNGFGTTHLDV